MRFETNYLFLGEIFWLLADFNNKAGLTNKGSVLKSVIARIQYNQWKLVLGFDSTERFYIGHV